VSGTLPSERKIDGSNPIPGILATHSAIVRTRRGQPLSLSLEGAETVYVVRSGTLMVRVAFSEGMRQVLTLLYPGDVFRSAFAPPAASARLLAVSPGEALRFRWSVFSDLAASHPEIDRFYNDAVAAQNARAAIHMAAVGRFDCRQRVATFLLELALRTGMRAPGGGLNFEIPLSRTDIADYLGLNADTLSRTMSRLRASGLLSHPERNRGLVRDLSALAALTPAARALMALSGEAMD
jgi:CRP/FNR family transcriptional regulator, anaerobic regulatory protein